MERTKYRVLLCAADYGSFSKAAELTGYTPSGVAHMMNAVEAEFGFPIFLRGRRGVSLTEDGKRVLPVLRELARWDGQLRELYTEPGTGLLPADGEGILPVASLTISASGALLTLTADGDSVAVSPRLGWEDAGEVAL